jgi:hypothetical protein
MGPLIENFESKNLHVVKVQDANSPASEGIVRAH